MRKVYVVTISSKALHSGTRVGAVYATGAEAHAEVQRLNAANSWTDARWVERQVEDSSREHLAGLQTLCDRYSDTIDELIESNRDSYECDEAIGLLCKLFDAIKDEEECTWTLAND